MKKRGRRYTLPPYDAERDGPLLDTASPSNALETLWLEPGKIRVSVIDSELGLEYQISEPQLTDFERELFTRVTAEVRDRLVSGTCSTISDALFAFIGESRLDVSPATVYKYQHYLERDFQNWGKIDALRLDDDIEDISCGGYGRPVFIYHRRYKSMRTNIIYTREELDATVALFAERCGKQISFADCLADASLPDGSRLQLTYGTAVSAAGSTFTMRRFRKIPLTPVDLIRNGTFTFEEMAYLWYAVETGHSVLVIGETASGKTTTLNALAQFIPPSAKIVSIEDTREIMLYHENWIPNQVPSFSKGEISMFDLLRAALRQRPEYLLVGEVRGRETLTMFQAINTGHTTFSTFHAGDITSAVFRLMNEPLNVPLTLLESLDIVISQKTETSEAGLPVRRCGEIVEISETSGAFGTRSAESPPVNLIFSGGVAQNASNVFSEKDSAEIARREGALRQMTSVSDYYSFIGALKEFYG